MKKLVCLLFLIFSCVWSGMAQDMPPPPPLIYSAPVESEIREYNSEEDGFSVKFPGIPKIESLAKSEEVKIKFYKVSRKGSNSIVTVATYKFEIEDKRLDFIKRYKERTLSFTPMVKNSPYPKIISEKEIEIGKYKGQEISYAVDELHFEVVRLIFVKNRLYELRTDVTNWHILNSYNKDKVKDFHQETERFFNSFQLKEK